MMVSVKRSMVNIVICVIKDQRHTRDELHVSLEKYDMKLESDKYRFFFSL